MRLIASWLGPALGGILCYFSNLALTLTFVVVMIGVAVGGGFVLGSLEEWAENIDWPDLNVVQIWPILILLGFLIFCFGAAEGGLYPSRGRSRLGLLEGVAALLIVAFVAVAVAQLGLFVYALIT